MSRRATAFLALFVVVVLLVGAVALTIALRHRAPHPLPAVAAPACGHSFDAKATDPSRIHGLFVYEGTQGAEFTPSEVTRYLLHNPDVCGVTLRVAWSQVDRGPGASPRYDWSAVTDQMEPWAAAGKVVNLLIGGAGEGSSKQQTETPEYVQRQTHLITCSPKSEPTPVFWSAGYEDNYKAFIRDTVSMFGSDSHVGYIRFGIGTGAEGVFLPEQIKHGSCASDWDAAGYSADWPKYFDSVVSFEGSLHSNVQLLVGLNNANSVPPIQTTAQEAATAGLGFGVEDLQAKAAAAILGGHPCPSPDWCQLFDQYRGRVPLYLQTLTASSPEGGKPATGPLPALLSAALAEHTQILEIYVQDWLAAFDPSYPGYTANHAAYGDALERAAAALGTSGGVKAVS